MLRAFERETAADLPPSARVNCPLASEILGLRLIEAAVTVDEDLIRALKNREISVPPELSAAATTRGVQASLPSQVR
jgi:hypothetical protein